jgi:hypothetical protein
LVHGTYPQGLGRNQPQHVGRLIAAADSKLAA